MSGSQVRIFQQKQQDETPIKPPNEATICRSGTTVTEPCNPSLNNPHAPPEHNDRPRPKLFDTRSLPKIKMLSPVVIGIGLSTAVSSAITIAQTCSRSAADQSQGRAQCAFAGATPEATLKAISDFTVSAACFAIALLLWLALEMVTTWPPVAFRLEDSPYWMESERAEQDKIYQATRIACILAFDLNLAALLLAIGFLGKGLMLLDRNLGMLVLWTMISLVITIILALSLALTVTW